VRTILNTGSTSSNVKLTLLHVVGSAVCTNNLYVYISMAAHITRKGGILGNAFRLPANAANTSVQMFGKKLLALWEGGPPYEVCIMYS
jgi:carotenoid cleavage dioxygenase-like enzyme